MATVKIDTKYLSVFCDRLIPGWFKEQYPLYESFICSFFQYLEQNNKPYHDIANIMDFKDIDAINTETDSVRREQLLNVVFEQYVGDANARYLSTLLDEILFLKNQKTFLSNKGIKANFMFFFLLVLGGYFRIENITRSQKLHNGIFRYDGTITYNSSGVGLEPFIYLIISEFYPEQYQQIIDNLNPAGMTYLPFFQRHVADYASTTGDGINDVEYTTEDMYMAFYNDSTFLGMVTVYSNNTYIKLASTATSWDLQLQSGEKYNEEGTGATHRFMIGVTNTSYFTGNFNRIKILSTPTPTGDFSYTIEPSPEGTVLVDHIFYLDTGDILPISDNTSIGVSIDFS